MALQIGDIAPDFSLYASEKKMVHLHELRGKPVVLLFFPLAFTSTCTKELCSARDEMAVYEELEAQILAISTDSPQSLARYKQDNDFNFTLLSDYNKEVIRAYDVMYEEFSLGMRGVAKRAVFVIDAEGVIRYLEVLEVAGHLPDMLAIQQALRSLHMV